MPEQQKICKNECSSHPTDPTEVYVQKALRRKLITLPTCTDSVQLTPLDSPLRRLQGKIRLCDQGSKRASFQYALHLLSCGDQTRANEG